MAVAPRESSENPRRSWNRQCVCGTPQPGRQANLPHYSPDLSVFREDQTFRGMPTMQGTLLPLSHPPIGTQAVMFSVFFFLPPSHDL